ncbi:hypothetical protein SLEP1_g51014 [Rubroshorea leprosula]|uniref:Uncharacterized protein n=1 Tax=Rubroshorea leprosula TaxID=152421 RepID=A0AAV5M541_9ROSI|nr:hypothetical protein SLEP1_g51014 [Rubroshorea leprosula]
MRRPNWGSRTKTGISDEGSSGVHAGVFNADSLIEAKAFGYKTSIERGDWIGMEVRGGGSEKGKNRGGGEGGDDLRILEAGVGLVVAVALQLRWKLWRWQVNLGLWF